MKKQIANLFTSCRIFLSLLLLFLPLRSAGFYGVYLFCGISDMLDGFTARRTNSVSQFGERLDTAADFIFMAAALAKWLPVLSIPGWLWIWIAAIAVFKVINFVRGFFSGKKIILPHTVMNKIVGLMLFLLPLTLPFVEVEYSVAATCFAATFASVHEFCLVGKGQKNASCI